VDEKFPPTDLDLDVLVKRVRKLVKAYPLIQRITLHELDGELPRYLISVEVENLVTGKPEGGFSDPVPADEILALRERGEMAKAKKGKKYNFRVVKPEYADLFDVINDWQPDSFPKLIGERFEAIYRPEYLHKLQRLKELEERRLRSGLNKDKWAIPEVKEWNATDEWMIELHEPGEEIIEAHGEKCWLLFGRGLRSETEKRRPRKSRLMPTEKAARTNTSKFILERRAFETFARRYWKNKDRVPTVAQTIRAAREERPDYYEQVTDKRMREWIYKEHPVYIARHGTSVQDT
jgi:hypothetical protein